MEAKTLLDEFAIAAMQAMLTDPTGNGDFLDPDYQYDAKTDKTNAQAVAERAYKFAIAMKNEKEKMNAI